MAKISKDLKNCDESVSNLLFNDIRLDQRFKSKFTSTYYILVIKKHDFCQIHCWILSLRKNSIYPKSSKINSNNFTGYVFDNKCY